MTSMYYDPEEECAPIVVRQFDTGTDNSSGLAAIPCIMMRGGTSRGVFFKKSDLPSEKRHRDPILIAALGSPHPLQVDGIGGGNPLTSKVAIVERSQRHDADVDYLFAQVNVERANVDYQATCGNLLSAVAHFAIETGLVAAGDPTTTVRINNINSNKITIATLETPNRQIRYSGNLLLSGIATPAAPVRMSFIDAGGAITGALLPSGKAKELIEGIEVSLVDYAIPVLIIDALAFGLSGKESPDEINANHKLLDKIEGIRLIAGQRMGLGDVSHSVVPKVALISQGQEGATLKSQYLMPWRCHLSHAVTGALCLAAASRIKGTIAAAISAAIDQNQQKFVLAHPTGTLEVECKLDQGELITSVLRSARLLFKGEVYVPNQLVENALGAQINPDRKQHTLSASQTVKIKKLEKENVSG